MGWSCRGSHKFGLNLPVPFLETDPLPAAVAQARRGQNGLGQGPAGMQSPLYLLLFLPEEMAHACLKLGLFASPQTHACIWGSGSSGGGNRCCVQGHRSSSPWQLYPQPLATVFTLTNVVSQSLPAGRAVLPFFHLWLRTWTNEASVQPLSKQSHVVD